jgi:hypothetical protein
MADRQAILDVLADYGWANDAKDEDVLRRIFAEKSRFYLTIAGMADGIGPYEGREAIIEFIMPTVRAQTDQRRHVIVNSRFTKDETASATVRAYLSLHVTDNGQTDVKSSGVYDVDFALEGDQWVITSMDLALDAPF